MKPSETTQPYYVTQARSYIRLIVRELDRADSAATTDSRHKHLIEAAKLHQSLGGVFAEIVLPSAAFNPELEGDKG